MEIRELRKGLGLTQDAFARKIGVSTMTIKRWEAKTCKPSPLALQQIKRLQQAEGINT